MERVYTQPYGTAGGLVVRDDKVLLVKGAKLGDGYDKWDLPSGGVELGEDPLQAARREVQEETGYQFTPTHILGVYSLVRQHLEPTQHPIDIVFLGGISKEPVGRLDEDVKETAWFTPEEVMDMDAASLRDLNIKTMVKHYLGGQKFPVSLLTHTVING